MSESHNHGYHTPLQSDEINRVNKDNHGHQTTSQMKLTNERVTQTTMVTTLHYSQMKPTSQRRQPWSLDY